MEIIVLGLIPLAFLLVIAGMVVVGQVSGFLQFGRYVTRERANGRVISAFLRRMALAQTELGRRARELEALTRRLKLGNEELARLNRLKTKFLSMAVHDLRTPLASIRGYGQMIESHGRLDEGDRRRLKNIMTATDQVGSLLADLVDLAVIEAGKLRMQNAPFDSAALVADAAAQAAIAAQAKGVALIAPEPAPGATLTGDRHRLARVLANLLGNAVKFTPSGGRVELRARATAGGLEFSVKDTGPGIHPTERRRIFEKFYQSRFLQGAEAAKGGWGLGLAIASEIVRAHGGELGVDSPGLGRGATFWARVPLVPPRVRPAGRAAAAAAAAAFLLALVAGPIRAQTIPLEEKARYEKALESRVDGVLIQILGPNRSKVVVDATLDFSRIERFESKEPPKAPGSGYLWDKGGGAAAAEGPELLPGMPATPAAQVIQAPPTSYERQNTFPDHFVKLLAVTVILDQSVKESDGEQIRGIVSTLLGLDRDRGDSLTMVHAAFAPVWKTIWYLPETAGMLAKYILLSLLSLTTLIVVAVCFLKLAGAMNAMAKSQSQQVSMDMNPLPAGGPAGLLEDANAPPGAAPEDGAPVPAAEEEPIVFNVRPDQVENLVVMLHDEDPANVALLATHLKPEVRRALLDRLPPGVSAQVLADLGRVRFVEPELIMNLKDELERRLAGAVGGVAALVTMIEAVEVSKRSAVLDAIRARDPKLAEEVRARIFSLEDLERLADDEWSLLLSRTRHEDWAAALADGPAGAFAALGGHMSPRAFEVLKELIPAAKAKGDEARREGYERVAAAVGGLVREGRIVNPASRPRELAADPAGTERGAA